MTNQEALIVLSLVLIDQGVRDAETAMQRARTRGWVNGDGNTTVPAVTDLGMSIAAEHVGSP